MPKHRADKRPAKSPDARGKSWDVGAGEPPAHTRFPKRRRRSARIPDAPHSAPAEATPGEQESYVERYADAIALMLIDRAIRGDVAAIKEILDRTEGKARQAVELTYTERQKLEIAVRGIMDDSGCTREQAVRALGRFRPEAFDLLDEY